MTHARVCFPVLLLIHRHTKMWIKFNDEEINTVIPKTFMFQLCPVAMKGLSVIKKQYFVDPQIGLEPRQASSRGRLC